MADSDLTRHEVRLSRRIYQRNIRRPCRFWFSAKQSPHLLIEGVSRQGRQAYISQIKKLKAAAAPGSKAIRGGLVVNRDGRYVFFGPNLKPSFLKKLARYVSDNVERVPALAGLAYSSCATVAVDIRDDSSLKAVDASTLALHTDTGLWSAVLKPSISSTAALLASQEPGRRMWFWYWPDAPAGATALIVQPIEWDPNMDRLEQLIAVACPDGSLDTFTGVCVPVDDGRLQLIAPRMVDEVLELLATWAKAHITDHPGLARLRDCELLVTDGARVVRVIKLPEQWTDFPTPTVPGTLSETAAVLAGLEAGQDAWFWQTAAGPEGAPFLTMLPVADDPNADHFNRRITGLNQRFPRSNGTISGTVRRRSSGGLLFTTSDALSDWSGQLSTLVARAAQAHPALQTLVGAKIVRLQGGKITAAQAAKSLN